MHSYIECEIATSNDKNHHTFRVRTDIGLLFMFQVSDKAALDRWVSWFKGGSTVANNNINIEKNNNNPNLDQLSVPAKMQSATFGGIVDNFSSIRRDGEYSSFYDTNIITTCQHEQSNHANDNSRSRLYQQSIVSNNTNSNNTESSSDQNLSMGNGNSFGVMAESSWQRYS
jgi:hypothetical protein